MGLGWRGHRCNGAAGSHSADGDGHGSWRPLASSCSKLVRSRSLARTSCNFVFTSSLTSLHGSSWLSRKSRICLISRREKPRPCIFLTNFKRVTSNRLGKGGSGREIEEARGAESCARRSGSHQRSDGSASIHLRYAWHGHSKAYRKHTLWSTVQRQGPNCENVGKSSLVSSRPRLVYTVSVQHARKILLLLLLSSP